MNNRQVCVLSVVLTAVVAGCQQSPVARAGKPDPSGRDIMATYSFGELYASLPAELSVPTLRAAAESTLRSRGYVITDSSSTQDRMRVLAVSRTDGRNEKSTITARLTPQRTAIVVDTGTFGDEATSRAILDDLLRVLGR